MVDLKPCPFCGSKNIGVLDTSSVNYLDLHFFAFCRSCGASSSLFKEICDAENAWNRRANDGKATD